MNAIPRLLQQTPYAPESAAEIVAILKRKRDDKSLDSARQVVEGFWKTRLIEIPPSRTCQYWQE